MSLTTCNQEKVSNIIWTSCSASADLQHVATIRHSVRQDINVQKVRKVFSPFYWVISAMPWIFIATVHAASPFLERMSLKLHYYLHCDQTSPAINPPVHVPNLNLAHVHHPSVSISELIVSSRDGLETSQAETDTFPARDETDTIPRRDLGYVSRPLRPVNYWQIACSFSDEAYDANVALTIQQNSNTKP